MSYLGTDAATDSDGDVSLDLDEASGTAVVTADLIARLTTPFGSLWYDADYGYDIRGLLNDSLSAADAARVQSRIAQQCRADDRVATASASVTGSGRSLSIRVRVTLVGEDETLELVASVDDITGEILMGTA